MFFFKYLVLKWILKRIRVHDQMSKTLIFPLDSSEYFNMFESINIFHVNKELGL